VQRTSWGYAPLLLLAVAALGIVAINAIRQR
jgi:hypothetical protein